jgi:hypothetical protein
VIETVEGGQHILARETGKPFTWTATAYDLCGYKKTSYSGGTLTRTFLTDATFLPTSGLSWSGGVGTVTFTPKLTETRNSLKVTDTGTGVNATSNLFDVSDTLCTPADVDPCHWEGNQGKILADAAPPPPNANLGIGFNPNVGYLEFSCNGASVPVGGTLVNINPVGYATPFTVSLTYKKTLSGSGPASRFVVCLSDNDGADWFTVSDCGSTPQAPCIQTQKRTSSGDLLIVLYLTQEDPWTGLH